MLVNCVPGAHFYPFVYAASNRVIYKTEVHLCRCYGEGPSGISRHLERPLPVARHANWVGSALFGPHLLHPDSEGCELHKLEHLFLQLSIIASTQSNPPQSTRTEPHSKGSLKPVSQGLRVCRKTPESLKTQQNNCLMEVPGARTTAFILFAQEAGSQTRGKNPLLLESQASPFHQSLVN